MTIPTTSPSIRMNRTVAYNGYAEWAKPEKQRCPHFEILERFHSIKPIDDAVRQHLTSIRRSELTPGKVSVSQHQTTPINQGLQRSLPTKSDSSNIFLLRFGEKSLLDAKSVSEQELGKELMKDEGSQLYIVQDLSPRTLEIFGPHWDIDPQFFLDYLDLVPKEVSKDEERKVKPTPWYRLGDIDYHLPPLRSTHPDMEHVVIRHIGPMEYRHEDNNVAPTYVPDRFSSDVHSAYVERVGGGHNPIYAETTTFWGRLWKSIMDTSGIGKQAAKEHPKLWPAAMIRHSTAVWFGRENSGQWKRGIILIDPPFKAKIDKEGQWTKWKRFFGVNTDGILEEGLEQWHSKFREFTSRPVLKSDRTRKVDPKNSYGSSLILCLESRMHGKTGVPSSYSILQSIYQIVASEWIVVNAYLERDLNGIEWRLEQSTTNPHTLEFFLRQLFIMRRRIRKYQALISDQLHMTLPSYWNSTPPDEQISVEIQKDFEQVQELINRSNDRIKDTVDLITSVMSVFEEKKSSTQNQGLVFLTVLATIALPFNVLAAVFGMDGENAPSNPGGWIAIRKNAITIACGTIGLYVLMFAAFRFRNMWATASAR